MARARAAIEGRRKSREAARAKTTAALTEIQISNGILSASHGGGVGNRLSNESTNRLPSLAPPADENYSNGDVGEDASAIDDAFASMSETSTSPSFSALVRRRGSTPRELSAATMETLAAISARRTVASADRVVDRGVQEREPNEKIFKQ